MPGIPDQEDPDRQHAEGHQNQQAHPDLRTHLRRVDVCRWGHAMIQPRVGFVSSGARRRAAEPMGPIHFAHSDLSGVALFEEAHYHGAVIRRLDCKRDSLQDIFLRAMEDHNGGV